MWIEDVSQLVPFALLCLQNCPDSESQVIRSGCVEVIDDCSPTIYNCKLTSQASGKFFIMVYYEASSSWVEGNRGLESVSKGGGNSTEANGRKRDSKGIGSKEKFHHIALNILQ